MLRGFRSLTCAGARANAFLAPPPRRPGLARPKSGLTLGDEVQLKDLRRFELNGQRGRVISEAPDEFGRLYVDLGCSEKPRIFKVLPQKLSPSSEDFPKWLPVGREASDPLGSSMWSSSGIRTGFPGFGILKEKEWWKPELREKHQDTLRLSHRSFVRTASCFESHRTLGTQGLRWLLPRAICGGRVRLCS